MKYYKLETRRGLPPITRLPLEPFANRFCVDILELMRDAAPEQLIMEETNGSFLTEDIVARLAQLRPIFLIVSLNGVSTDARRDRMRETDEVSAQTAMRSPFLLREHKIPFAISYVPWFNRPLEELEEVVGLAESEDAVAARISLPMTLPGWENYWEEIVQFIHSLRSRVGIPIWTNPPIYEWQTIRPEVRSIIRNSPAAVAGIRYKDLITSIAGQEVITQREANRLLSMCARDSTKESIKVIVERNGGQFEASIEHSQCGAAESYPYSQLPVDFLPFGIDIPDTLGFGDIMVLKSICEEHRGKRILLLIPSLAVANFQEALSFLQDYVSFLDEVELYLASVQPMFYAGNGWLPARFWTIPDIARTVNDWISRNGPPVDVILIPSGILSPGGRDLLGQNFLDLELQLDTEVCEVRICKTAV